MNRPCKTHNRRLIRAIVALVWGAATMTAAADVPTISVGNSSLVRPTATTQVMEFSVTRTGDTSYPVTVGFETENDTAIAGVDYTAVTDALIISAGATGASVQIPILPGSSTLPKDLLLKLNSVSGPLAPDGLGTRTDFATGSGAISITAADFNGDGRMDLATANSVTNGSVSVLLNTTADASTPNFAAPVDFATGRKPRSVIELPFVFRLPRSRTHAALDC